MLLRQVDRVGAAKKTDAVNVDDTLAEAELTVDAAAIEGATEEEVRSCFMRLFVPVCMIHVVFCVVSQFPARSAIRVGAPAMLVSLKIGSLLSWHAQLVEEIEEAAEEAEVKARKRPGRPRRD